MKTKQLAEMIKALRKQKLDEYRSRSMVQPPARKGNLTPAGHMSHTKQTDITKAGPSVVNKYKPARLVSEKEHSNTKSTLINTTPEQDSAMIGTQ